uniref:Carboxypeptidase B2 n=1 Tax=Anser cygnoides TaxID=8845 RepID=A0A8B9ED79_ANSCY
MFLETLQVILWQPVVAEYIKKNIEVHFYVAASSINSIKANLRKLSIQHKYVFISCHEYFSKLDWQYCHLSGVCALSLFFRILMGDVQGLIEKQTINDTVNPRSSSSYYQNYHSLKEIYYWMEEVARVHSDLLEKIHIGSSYEKRPLYVLKLSKGQGNPKSAIWIDCGIHAREWISPAFCLWFIDQTMTTLLEHFDFYVMPVINVDGYEYTWSHPSNRLWRKSRSRHGNNRCIGTDMNRNFDAQWCGKGASPNECYETYCGPYPESEPEVKAVARFIRDHKDIIKAYITMHSYSQLVLFPYSYTMKKSKDHDELVKGNALILGLQSSMGLKTRISSMQIMSPGGSDDWAYDLGIKYSFTIELRDTGTYGFLLPPEEIRPTCLEALSAVKEIAQHVLQNL